MNTLKTYAAILAIAFAAVLFLGACGGGGDSSDDAPAQEGSNAARSVSVANADGVGEVLVDTEGAALYAADQEVGGMVLCTEGCAAIWDPLTVSGSEDPTAGDGLAGKLGVVERPDGARQVTFEGRLLYRFVEDPSPGIVTGNGFADTFAGQAFTWHVVTPSGVSTSSVNSTPSSDGYGF
jgi:predicted lipoprotein with Yx(FWY)xxD motif